MSGFWQGTECRIAVFQQRWEKGRMIQHFIVRRKVRMEPLTMTDLFEEYPLEEGYTFTITPRRPGDTHDGA